MSKSFITVLICGSLAMWATSAFAETQPGKPNIVLIYADDLGYGDLGCYGSRAIPTPNVDNLSAAGLRFTSAYATSSTCKPSRYGLLTGEYPWRKPGHNILQGDAPMIIQAGSSTLPAILRKGGYKTAVVGKWHLGLGSPGSGADWNVEVKPGPREVGFDYSYIMAATGDRVPTVFLENRKVVNLDPKDPIAVSYKEKIGNEPTGRDNPDLLKFGADNQHSDTITNGVSRIGFMTGGKAALWKDDELGDHFTGKAVAFIEEQKDKPFFLFFALHEPHVPRVPAPRFVGKTALGPRGDVIAQLDAHVGAITETLKRLGLTENTLVILTSDNGPVLNDGYSDDSVDKNGEHTPAGPFSGGKYSKLEGGTRVPMIVSWPGKITPGVSAAATSQIDLLASFAALTGQEVPKGVAPDSKDASEVLLGKSRTGRSIVIQEGSAGLALRSGDWKFIPARKGAPNTKLMRTGNSPEPQLYNLATDPAEKVNLAKQNPDKVKELSAVLEGVRQEKPSAAAAADVATVRP
jgi:arylsulfatase A-like enzyme